MKLCLKKVDFGKASNLCFSKRLATLSLMFILRDFGIFLRKRRAGQRNRKFRVYLLGVSAFSGENVAQGSESKSLGFIC